MSTDDNEPRIAVFLDYENLAIGARETLGSGFDFADVADALAERGRVIVRRAYADWSYFDSDRRMLTRHQVELIEIPQKMGGSRKNAADIKLAIDAVELALERDYITTFVIGTGDSDLSPLVHKLRELDRQVIGIGIRGSTSKLLPPACDEFMFYDNLVSGPPDAPDEETEPTGDAPAIVLSTLASMESSTGSVRASTLKRAVLRKDPTFSESNLGFRNFGGLLASLRDEGLLELEGKGDPTVSATGAAAHKEADDLLREVVKDKSEVPFSGLKTALRKADGSFSERRLGYKSFGAYIRDAEARGIVRVEGEDPDRVVKGIGRRPAARKK